MRSGVHCCAGRTLEEGLSLLFLLRIYLGAIEVRLEEEKEESFKRRNEANIREDALYLLPDTVNDESLLPNFFRG